MIELLLKKSKGMTQLGETSVLHIMGEKEYLEAWQIQVSTKVIFCSYWYNGMSLLRLRQLHYKPHASHPVLSAVLVMSQS